MWTVMLDGVEWGTYKTREEAQRNVDAYNGEHEIWCEETPDDWHEIGQEYAKAWEPGKTLPTFPSDQDNHDFYEGYETGWWERGNDDCRFNRSKRTDFPDNKAKLAYLDGWADEEEC